MKLENQVCTLEQAKRLKELEVAQESLCHWTYYANNSNPHLICNGEIRDAKDLYNIHFCSAFTVAELGVMLPASYKDYYGNNNQSCYWYLDLNKHPDEKKGFIYRYHNRFNTEADAWNNLIFQSINEASARAAMLIYLIENNLTTADEVNKRLKA